MPRSQCDAHVEYVRGCPDCRVRARDYARARRAGLAAGAWAPGYVSPEELDQVRKHVARLLAVGGVTTRLITEVAGVSHHGLDAVRPSVPARGARPSRMTREVADALLGVTAAACLAVVVDDTARVDPTGSRRRLQALAVDGWDTVRIAALAGIHINVVRVHRSGRRNQTMTRGHRERYRQLYEKIQSLADPRGGSVRASLAAERLGWLGPEHWPDEDIDDPDAEPLPPPPETDDWAEVSRMIDGALRDPSPGKAREHPRHIKREIARQATTRLGWSYARVAELLGLGGPDGAGGTSAVEYLLYGRKDRPRTKELWKSGK